MTSLPDPNFIDRDPDAITAELVAKYEAATGKTLYPGQVERLLINLIAYAKTMTHVGIQEAAKQNLVRFSSEPMVDYLGDLVSVPRIDAGYATTTLRFSLAAGLATDLAIPVGSLASSGDGKVSFATNSATTIPAGQLSVDVSSTCTTGGTIGNGWQLDQIKVLGTDLGDVEVSVTNITVSDGGTEREQTSRYKERIMDGPEAFSTAGPGGAYRAHARASHPSIIDVGVVGPELELVNGQVVSRNHVPAGAVFVYPMVETGVPDESILSLVRANLNQEKLIPLSDYIEVLPIEPVDYSITAYLTLLDTSSATAGTLDTSIPVAAARKAAQAKADYLASGRGRHVVVNDFIKEMKVNGVYDLSIPSLPENLVVEEYQFARCTGINVSVAGVRKSNG